MFDFYVINFTAYRTSDGHELMIERSTLIGRKYCESMILINAVWGLIALCTVFALKQNSTVWFICQTKKFA